MPRSKPRGPESRPALARVVPFQGTHRGWDRHPGATRRCAFGDCLLEPLSLSWALRILASGREDPLKDGGRGVVLGKGTGRSSSFTPWPMPDTLRP